MVVWIEIGQSAPAGSWLMVTTCVVVWIEIMKHIWYVFVFFVTTCVVVWIEIRVSGHTGHVRQSHHLRGGVD